MYHSRIVLSVGGSVGYMVRNLRYTVTIDSVLANSKTQNAFLFTVHAIFRHDYPLAMEPTSTPRPLVQKKKKLWEILYILICSFLPCLSWLLRSRVRKFRRDLWINLYIYIYIYFSVRIWCFFQLFGDTYCRWKKLYIYIYTHTSVSEFDVFFPTYWRHLLQMEEIISHHSLQLISTIFFGKLFILPLADIKISFPLLPIASLRLCHSAIDSDKIILIFN